MPKVKSPNGLPVAGAPTENVPPLPDVMPEMSPDATPVALKPKRTWLFALPVVTKLNVGASEMLKSTLVPSWVSETVP